MFDETFHEIWNILLMDLLNVGVRMMGLGLLELLINYYLASMVLSIDKDHTWEYNSQ